MGGERSRRSEVEAGDHARARRSNVEPSNRARQLASLQRSVGNRATALFVQRWTVPAELACDEVVPYMDANSPHAPEWAATTSTHSFSGNVRVKHVNQPDGTVTSSAKGHPGVRVRVSSPVDRPQWNPTRRPNRAAEVAAWQAMRASLDAHEAEHQRIGRVNNAELDRRYKAVDLSVTGPDRQSNTADLTSQLQTEQQSWADWAQGEQSAIDPFRGANLACPAPPDEESDSGG